ncbi:hypothetical protein M5K25_015503 [Dendrobium thyrsiflorum]|uniref:rRNA methyltransferase 2, mitochondrial n=1 Tax=Dendrobium thyrsiflorum TaxID=117978 RepID=A0ABD0UYD3_DENTH
MSGPWAPDFFWREAQRLGYVARSAFKIVDINVIVVQLLQMQKQFKLIGAGASVLDLGCAPGAWLQVPWYKQEHLVTQLVGISEDLDVSLVSVSFKSSFMDSENTEKRIVIEIEDEDDWDYIATSEDERAEKAINYDNDSNEDLLSDGSVSVF